MRKLIISTVVAVALATSLVACGDHQVACAETIAVAFKSSGANKAGPSGGGGSSGGGGARSGGGGSSGGAPKAPSPPPPPKPGAPSNNKAGSSGAGQNKTAAQSKASASGSAKPSSKPDPATSKAVADSAPKTVTKGGSYTSSVTGNTYIYHSRSYYTRPGFVMDYYDPYNPYNYWYFPLSPFYGRPYAFEGQCGGQQKQVVEDKNNINITIDNDGKVTKAEDKNKPDPDIDEKVEADDQPAADTVNETTTTGG